MVDLAAVWARELPEIRGSVTGVGVWAALNACQPVTLEDGVLIMGLKHEESELSGHLRLPHIRTVIERSMSEALSAPITLRVIDGIGLQDWETVKRRDQEAKRLQDLAMEKFRMERDARTNWDSVYEQLNRAHAAVGNKSLPQNRARYFRDAVEIVSNARKNYPMMDDLAERNYARCLERIAQYTELSSAYVAWVVMQKTGEL